MSSGLKLMRDVLLEQILSADARSSAGLGFPKPNNTRPFLEFLPGVFGLHILILDNLFNIPCVSNYAICLSSGTCWWRHLPRQRGSHGWNVLVHCPPLLSFTCRYLILRLRLNTCICGYANLKLLWGKDAIEVCRLDVGYPNDVTTTAWGQTASSHSDDFDICSLRLKWYFKSDLHS